MEWREHSPKAAACPESTTGEASVIVALEGIQIKLAEQMTRFTEGMTEQMNNWERSQPKWRRTASPQYDSPAEPEPAEPECPITDTRPAAQCLASPTTGIHSPHGHTHTSVNPDVRP